MRIIDCDSFDEPLSVSYLRRQSLSILESDEAILRENILVFFEYLSTAHLFLDLAQIGPSDHCYIELLLHSLQKKLFYTMINWLRRINMYIFYWIVQYNYFVIRRIYDTCRGSVSVPSTSNRQMIFLGMMQNLVQTPRHSETRRIEHTVKYLLTR